VIWQGPDIPCIKLCTGDTVSDVIFKLATELCAIMDQLNVSNYDLTCLGITACPPEDFQALIQLLITKICELNGITPTEGKSSGCPDCVVSVAPCFVEGNQTTMQLVDYVQMIANRVCSILAEIQVINDAINNLVNITNDLQFQIDNLPVYELPKITLTSCSIGSYAIGSQVSLDTLINVFLNDVWCPFYAATGTTSDLLSAVAEKCIFDSTLQLSTGTAYGLNPNWIADANYNTVADAINNIWVVLCDVFNYVDGLSAITVEDTNTVDLTYTGGVLTADVVDTGWVDLLGFNWFVSTPTYRPQCRRIGNVIHFRGALMVPLADDSGSVINYTYGANDTYVGRTEVTPFTGVGGVTVDNQGAIYFNNNTSVIPTSVLPDTPSPILFDQNLYSSNYIVASRYILYNDQFGDQSTFSGILHAVCKIFIYSNKRMALQILKDNEYSAGGAAGNIFGTSALNSMVSRVTLNDRIQRWRTNITDPGTWPDFHSSNIMSGSTTAIPTTPVSNISNPREINYSNDYRFPFTCDAGQPNNLGGFGWVQLEGLSAFISPCSREIPTPTPCE
jgi:hypothetical protein